MSSEQRAVNRATRAALNALGAAVRDSFDRKRYSIDRFGRHPDGYLHARVIVDGTRRLYFHCRYGSWLAPGQFNGVERLKEPEALLGGELGRSVKWSLAEQARKFHPTAPPEEDTDDHSAEPDVARGGDETVPADRP